MAAGGGPQDRHRGLPRPLPARPGRQPPGDGGGHPQARLLQAVLGHARLPRRHGRGACSSPRRPPPSRSRVLAALGPADAGAVPGPGRRRRTRTSSRPSTPPSPARSSARARCWPWSRRSCSRPTRPRPATSPARTPRPTRGLPNYTNNLRRLDPTLTDEDFADAGSDRLVDSIVAWGTEDADPRPHPGPPRRRRRPRLHPGGRATATDVPTEAWRRLSDAFGLRSA